MDLRAHDQKFPSPRILFALSNFKNIGWRTHVALKLWNIPSGIVVDIARATDMSIQELHRYYAWDG